jgi:hypothetical protein
MKDKVFQDDCFELDPDALPTEIFISPRQQDLTHSKPLGIQIESNIFDNMLKIYIMLSNRELSICDNIM